MTVPHSVPQTTAKDRNYALSLADVNGKLVTVFDVEGIPDPLQLRRAVVAFGRSRQDVGCLQARPGYYNDYPNLLTRWVSRAYDRWFSAVLPSLKQARRVVPLVGGSSHLPADVLRHVGGWGDDTAAEHDSLGARLDQRGYRSLILNSMTREEAATAS